jgi:hypothetical protein
MSKFVVIIPQCLPATQDVVTRHFSTTASYWHWSPDVWLLHFRTPKSAVQIRDELRGFLPGVQLLVIRFEDRQREWAGFGPKDWENWFGQFWENMT